MASWQAHLLDVLLRVRIKRRGRGALDVGRIRASLHGKSVPGPKEVDYRAGTLGGVVGEWIIRPGEETGPLLLYLHGGGYFACSPRTHRAITGRFAKAGCRVFAPDYRLAPEHPFPAAVDDAEAVWDALPAGLVGLAGDSAGGGLALGLMVRLRDRGKRLPAAAVLFSPWTDLAATGDSLRGNARRDAMFWPEAIPTVAGWYLGGADPRSPEASPLYADLAGLPPLFIEVGEREILRDDSTRLAARAREAGVVVILTVWPVVAHVWQLAGSFLPEARQSVAKAAAFLTQYCLKP